VAASLLLANLPQPGRRSLERLTKSEATIDHAGGGDRRGLPRSVLGIQVHVDSPLRHLRPRQQPRFLHNLGHDALPGNRHHVNPCSHRLHPANPAPMTTRSEVPRLVRGEERLDIRDMCQAGMSVGEIHRRTGRDPKTIRRMRDRAEPVRESVAEPARPSKLNPFKAYVLERLKQGVLNAVRIRWEIVPKGYDGGLTILREFMIPHRPVCTAKVSPRFETEPEQQAQVDVGHFTYRGPEGRLRKTYWLAAVLGYSRMLYALSAAGVPGTRGRSFPPAAWES